MDIEHLTSQFVDALPEDTQPELARAARKQFARHLDIVTDAWKARPMDQRVTLNLQQAGLPDTMTTKTNVYGSLCYHLYGARALDWGWGFGNVICAASLDTVHIDQSGLAYVADLFKYFEDAFDTMTPDVSKANKADGELANQWKAYFAYALRYGYERECGEEQPQHAKPTEAERFAISEIAVRLALPSLFQ